MCQGTGKIIDEDAEITELAPSVVVVENCTKCKAGARVIGCPDCEGRDPNSNEFPSGQYN